MGDERRPGRHSRLAPRERFHSALLEGIRRGAARLHLGLGSPSFPLPTESYAAYCSTYQWREFTGAKCSTPGHCSRISSHTCGSTFAASATGSCSSTTPTISKTAGRRPTSIRPTRLKIPAGSSDTASTAGASPPPTGRGGPSGRVEGRRARILRLCRPRSSGRARRRNVAPWVVLASLPFAPEIVIPTINHMAQLNIGVNSRYGFKPSFNQTFEVPDSPTGWWVRRIISESTRGR